MQQFSKVNSRLKVPWKMTTELTFEVFLNAGQETATLHCVFG